MVPTHCSKIVGRGNFKVTYDKNNSCKTVCFIKREWPDLRALDFRSLPWFHTGSCGDIYFDFSPSSERWNCQQYWQFTLFHISPALVSCCDSPYRNACRKRFHLGMNQKSNKKPVFVHNMKCWLWPNEIIILCVVLLQLFCSKNKMVCCAVCRRGSNKKILNLNPIWHAKQDLVSLPRNMFEWAEIGFANESWIKCWGNEGFGHHWLLVITQFHKIQSLVKENFLLIGKYLLGTLTVFQLGILRQLLWSSLDFNGVF